MLTELETAWLSGYLEGEGSFDLNGGKYPRVRVSCVDKDVLEKVSVFLGTGVNGPYIRKAHPEKQPIYSVEKTGSPAVVTMQAILPWMGHRRADRIKHILEFYGAEYSVANTVSAEIEMVWLAALLEGEAFFGGGGGKKLSQIYPSIRVRMTDLDVVQRAARLLGSKAQKDVWASQHRGHKVLYVTGKAGTAAAIIMRQILPYMGLRRSQKIREVLEVYDNYVLQKNVRSVE